MQMKKPSLIAFMIELSINKDEVRVEVVYEASVMLKKYILVLSTNMA